MTCFEDLSGEILMAIFEYMNVEDVWTIFLNMNSRFCSLVADSRLRLIADVLKVDKLNFDQFCLSLINTNFSNIYTLVLSNHYNRYPQIRLFLSQTNFTIFQSLQALTLIDVNHDDLLEVMKQIKALPLLSYFHVKTHEIFRDKELANVTLALLNNSNIRISLISLHERLQWLETESISSCNAEVLSLDFINADRLFCLLPHCPRLRSLTVTLDSRTSLTQMPTDNISSTLVFNTFAQITNLRLSFRPFDVKTLDRLLTSVPSVRRFSIQTLIYNCDYIRSPFWTVLLQKLPLLERIHLVVRGWFVLKVNNYTNIEKLDAANIIDSYRYDKYWLDRTSHHIFTCHIESSTAVLEIR